MTACFGQQQRRPGLQAPGQRGHDHVSPVALQIIHRRRQGPHAVLELLDDILLVATSIGLEHNLFGRMFPVVRDVEEA